MKKIGFKKLFLPIFLIAGFLFLQTAAARDFTIQSTAGIPYLKVDGNTGRIGIGITAPSSTLHVVPTTAGTFSVLLQTGTSTNGSEARLDFVLTSATPNLPTAPYGARIGAIRQGSNGMSDLYFSNSDVNGVLYERMRITSAGYVGIGTSSPSSLLHVFTSVTTIPRGIVNEQVTSDAASAYMEFRKARQTGIVSNGDYIGSFNFLPYTGTGYINTAGFISQVNGTVTTTSIPTDVSIWTSPTNETSPANNGKIRLTIKSSGNIGIGTTTPSYTLDVVGTAQFSQPIIVGTPTIAGHATTKSYVDSVLTGGTATGTLANLTVTGTTTLAITGGSVGIGTTTPGYALTLGSGQIAAPAGLVGTPSYSFTSDPDSGFYSGGSGVINIALNGANQYRIDDALGIYMVNASKWRLSVDDTSATAPNIIPNRTYTTTGIGSAGANIVSLIANGINGLNVNSGGNVGIATTTPASLFTVASSTGSANFFQVQSNGNIIAGSGGSSQWQSSSTAFTFNTPVNLGNIVTASDLGSHTLYNQPVTSASVVGTNVGPTFSIDSNPVLTIYGESDGNGGAQNLRVGIGDTTPSYTLDVVGTAQFSQPIIVGTPTIDSHATTKSYVDSVLTGGTATGTLANLTVTGTTTLATAGGNVGIGTTTPGTKLHVIGSGTVLDIESTGVVSYIEIQGSSTGYTNTSDGFTLGMNGTNAYVRNREAASLFLGTNGADHITILSGGNVGIGDTSPAAMLTVGNGDLFQVNSSGAITASAGITTTGQLTLSGSSANIALGSNYLSGDGGDEGIFVDSAGSVGIGTTTPGTPLHVLGSTFPVGLIERTSAETNTVLSSLGVRHTTTGDMADGFGAGFTFQIKDSAGAANPVGAIFGVRNGADNSGRMAFYTYNAGTGSEKMTITSDGYVGIGTTTPSKKLDIVGTTRIQGTGFTASSLDYDLNIVSNTNSTSTYPHLMVANRNQSGNSLAKIGFNAGDGAIIAAFVADLAGYGTGQSYTASGLDSPGAGIQVYGNYPFMIKTNNVERLRVANDGKVGIGTTTPSYTLDVVGTAQFSQPIIVGTPTIAGHATTKSYVDSVLTGGTATGTLANLTVTGTTTLATTAGNVGIGYTTPGSVLPTTFTSANSKIIEARSVSTGDVGLFLRRGSDDAAGLDMWSDNSSGDSYIDNRHNADTSDIRFRTKTAATAVNAMIITGAGNVGIGDTDPDQALEVMSSAAAGTQVTISNTNSGDADPRIGFELADGTNTFTVGVDDSDSDKFKISTTALGTNARLVIDSSGNIGIATSTPAAKLDIAGTADSIQLIVRASTTQSNSNPLVQLRKSDNNILSSWHSDNAENLYLGYNNAPNNNITGTGSEGVGNVFIGFLVGNGNTTGTRNTALGSEAFEFNSTGYFNTAMGSFASHYNSTGANNSSFGFFANYQNQTGSNNTAFGSESGYNNASGSGNVFLGYRAGYNETGSNKLYIANSSTNPPLIFGDFSSARIGLGTTTPAYSLHVEGTGYFSQPLLVGAPTVDGHAATKSYVDSAVSEVSSTSTFTTITVSGTSTLATAGGNVGIGTSSPSAKLDVQGNFNVSSDATIGNFNYLGTNCTFVGGIACGVNTLQVNGTIGASGGVVIGATSTAGDGLEVFSAAVFRSSSTLGGPVIIGTTTWPNDAIPPLSVRGTSSFIGRIGIGTSIPSYDVSFDGDTAHTIGAERRISSGAGFGLMIQAGGASSTSNATGGTLTLSGGISTGNTSSSIQFYTATAGSSGSTTRTPTVKMTLTGAGSLGIGTTNPSYTLDVSGTGQFTQPLLVGTPTLTGHAATKNYVDPYMVFLKTTGTGSTTAYSAINGNVGIGDFSLGAATAKLEVKGGVRLNTTEAKPTCDSNQRGTIWHTQGGVLVKDSLEVCVKTGSDTYVWNAIY